MRGLLRNAVRRGGRRACALVALASTLALVVGTAQAGSPTPTKNAVASISPTSVCGGSTQLYALTLENLQSSNQALGSANVAVAAGFTVDASSLSLTMPAGKSWRPPVLADGVMQLRSTTEKSKLSPDQQLVLRFRATAPLSAAAPAVWRTVVKQSNDFLGTGNEFNVASQPAVTVVGGGAAGCVVCTALPCELNDPQDITDVRIDARKPLPAPVTISVSDSGIPFGDGTCGAPESLGRVATIVPDASVPSDILLEVTFTYGSKVVPQGTGVEHFRFCANDGPGTPYYEVFDCKKPLATATPKCISKRNATGTADLVITVLMTWTDPDWGGF